MKVSTAWLLAVMVLPVIISPATSASATLILANTLFFDGSPRVQLALTPVGVQSIVTANFTNTAGNSIGVYMWTSVLNPSGQTVGVFLGSATIGGGQSASVSAPLFELPPESYGAQYNYTAQVFATSTRGVVLSSQSTVSFRYPPKTPFNYTLYLTSSGSCSTFFPNGTAYAEPCFGGFNQAYVFDCASAAASPSGCTRTITSSFTPFNSYNITVWYPYAGQPTIPSWANCAHYVKGQSGSVFAYCIPVGSTAFIMSEQGPPPL